VRVGVACHVVLAIVVVIQMKLYVVSILVYRREENFGHLCSRSMYPSRRSRVDADTVHILASCEVLGYSMSAAIPRRHMLEVQRWLV
jgi:hypothetical protein